MILLFLWIATSSCYREEEIVESTNIDLDDWSSATHTDSDGYNYDIVFPQDEVNRIDLVISQGNWNTMLDDLESIYGVAGTSSEYKGGMIRPGGPGTGGQTGSFSSVDPVFVDCSVFFNGIEWYRVGVRFKGNSSLMSTWSMGLMKLSFKLDFTEFSDEYPEIKGQRFYGFRQLNLKNNYDDNSFMREKVASDIFRESGIPSPQTAFYRVYVDYGEGPVYFGLYTMVEEPEDTMLASQFSDASGNLYKPENTGASFANGTFNTDDFTKKTNLESDYTDVESLYIAINSQDRINNYETWKENLATVFDVEQFMHWLAVNTVIQNWDTYGIMTHNYYLYNNPEVSKIQWIPWDNNEALNDGKQGGTLSITLNEVEENWPLIRYLIDDEEYKQYYINYIEDLINNAFEPSKMMNTYANYQTLLEPFVVGVDGEIDGYTFLRNDNEFYEAVTFLNNHVDVRNTIASNYLSLPQ
jgi:spore coat protein H